MLLAAAIGVLALFLNSRRRRHKLELFHKERLATIDKGLELPPLPEQFFYDMGNPPSPHRTLLKGLIFTLGGLGIWFSLNRYEPEYALYALVPILVGLAFLIFYFAVGRREALALEAKRSQSPVAVAAPAA
jgi:hypothetical protein